MFDFKSFTENLGTTLNALTPKITVSFAAAAWILLYIHIHGLMLLPVGIVLSALIVAVLCTCLAFTSLIAYLWDLSKVPRHHVGQTFKHRRDKKHFEKELDYFLPKEREIFSYLLAKQQKLFEVLPDGEEAATLIAKGFVVLTTLRPPAIHRYITVEVPPHVWEVLVRNREKFLCKESASPLHPWQTHYKAR